MLTGRLHLCRIGVYVVCMPGEDTEEFIVYASYRYMITCEVSGNEGSENSGLGRGLGRVGNSLGHQ